MKPRLIIALIYLFAGLFISFILFLGLAFFLFTSTLSAGEFLIPQSNASPIMYYFLIFTSLFVGIIPISIYLSRFYSKPKVFIIGIVIVLVLAGIVIGIYNISSNSNEVIETSFMPVAKPNQSTNWKPAEPELTFEEARKMPQIPPGNIIARKDNGKIIISWDSTESDQAAEYKVYGKSNDGKTWQFLGSVKYKVGKSTYELRTTSSATEFTVSTVSIYGVEGPQGNTAIVNY